MVSIARLLLAFCMVFTYPMECFVTRHCFLSILDKILSDREISKFNVSNGHKECSIVEQDEADLQIGSDSRSEHESENGDFEGLNPMTERSNNQNYVRSVLSRESERSIFNPLNGEDHSNSRVRNEYDNYGNRGNTSGNNNNDSNNSNNNHDKNVREISKKKNIFSSYDEVESKDGNGNYFNNYGNENEYEYENENESEKGSFVIKFSDYSSRNSILNDVRNNDNKNDNNTNNNDHNNDNNDDNNNNNNNSSSHENSYDNNDNYDNIDDNKSENSNNSNNSNCSNESSFNKTNLSSPGSNTNERSEIEEGRKGKNIINYKEINNKRIKISDDNDNNNKNNSNNDKKVQKVKLITADVENLIKSMTKIIDAKNEKNNFHNKGHKEFENIDLNDKTICLNFNNSNNNDNDTGAYKNNLQENRQKKSGIFCHSSSSSLSDSDIKNLKNSKMNKGYHSNIYLKLKYNSYHPVTLINKIINSENNSSNFFNSCMRCNCNCKNNNNNNNNNNQYNIKNCTKLCTFSYHFPDKKSFFRLIVTLALWSSSVAIALIFKDLGIVLALTGKYCSVLFMFFSLFVLFAGVLRSRDLL